MTCYEMLSLVYVYDLYLIDAWGADGDGDGLLSLPSLLLKNGDNFLNIFCLYLLCSSGVPQARVPTCVCSATQQRSMMLKDASGRPFPDASHEQPQVIVDVYRYDDHDPHLAHHCGAAPHHYTRLLTC